MLKKNCFLCKKEFTRDKKMAYSIWNNKKFCSNKCYWDSMKGIDSSFHLGKYAQKGNLPPTHFKSTGLTFKGTKSEYKHLHYLINKQLGKAVECTYCGTNDNVEWANVSGKYLEDLEDWIPLCRKCHWHYDKQYERMYI